MPVIGTQQSPIRIVREETIHAKIPSLQFGYVGLLPGVFSGHDFVFDIKTNASGAEITTGKELIVGGVTWVIRKIHIHNPAEHLFDEEPAAGFECHLLHSLVGDTKARGPKLVVGVFFKVVPKPPKKARPRPSLKALNDAVSAAMDAGQKPCSIAQAHDLDVNDFLPDKDPDKFYRYEGSLTSPPYSEDVSWHVLKQQSEVFDSNVAQIMICAKQEARPVHAIDRRFILRNFA